MSDKNNNNNEFSELNNNETSKDGNFEEFKPDASAYQAEQESLKDAHKNRDDLNQPDQEISEEDKKFAPGYQPEEPKATEEKIKQKEEPESSETEEEITSEEEEKYKPQELRKITEPQKAQEKPKEKKYYGKEEPFSQYQPTFDEKELEPDDEADFEDPCKKEKKEDHDLDKTSNSEESKTEEEKPATPKVKSTYNANTAIPELDEDTRIYAGICHLTTVLGFTALWLPIIFYFIKHDDEDIKFHAKQATVSGFIFLLLIATLIFVLFIAQCLCCLSPFVLITIFILWCYAAYVSYMVFTGSDYRIPFICDLVDEIDF